jgi:hypothetical protein
MLPLDLLKQLDPKTDGTVKVKIMADAVPLPDATVTADVFDPEGVSLAQDVVMPYSGSDGIYVLTVPKEWSTATGGEAIEGVFEAQVSASRFGKTRTHRIRYLVQFIK